MKSAADLVQEHLLYMTTDLTKWRALFDENAIWDFAFAPSAGLAGVARGIAEIAKRVEGFVNRVEGLSFSDLKIYQIDGEDAVFAEFEGQALVTANGRHYHQNYVVYLRADKGKIVFAREYFDATRVVAAFSWGVPTCSRYPQRSAPSRILRGVALHCRRMPVGLLL